MQSYGILWIPIVSYEFVGAGGGERGKGKREKGKKEKREKEKDGR